MTVKTNGEAVGLAAVLAGRNSRPLCAAVNYAYPVREIAVAGRPPGGVNGKAPVLSPKSWRSS